MHLHLRTDKLGSPARLHTPHTQRKYMHIYIKKHSRTHTQLDRSQLLLATNKRLRLIVLQQQRTVLGHCMRIRATNFNFKTNRIRVYISTHAQKYTYIHIQKHECVVQSLLNRNLNKSETSKRLNAVQGVSRWQAWRREWVRWNGGALERWYGHPPTTNRRQ